jgi:hypothetical protein
MIAVRPADHGSGLILALDGLHVVVEVAILDDGVLKIHSLCSRVERFKNINC